MTQTGSKSPQGWLPRVAAAALLALSGAAPAHGQDTPRAANPPAEAAKSESANAAAQPRINDFPTQARVEYVLQCMRERDGPQQELLYKCVCAVDEIAAQVNHDEFVSLSTFANALTIAGERGAALRDRADSREMAGKYRALVARTNKACFLKAAR